MLLDRENQFGVVEPVSSSPCRSIQLQRRKAMGEGMCAWVLSHPEVSLAVHPCLAADGAPLSWHGHFGTGAPLSMHLADDGYRLVDITSRMGVKAALLIWLKRCIWSHVQERMWYSSLSHLLPTWDVGKKHLFFSPLFLIFVVGERLPLQSKKGWGSLTLGNLKKRN